jgi:hypothetical protein
MWFAELFANLRLCFEGFKFWKNKRARPKYEKENNLTKKIMIYPSNRISVRAIILLSISGGILLIVFTKNLEEDRTIKKLTKIENLGESAKRTSNSYPSELSKAIRNNPLNKNLLTDAIWHCGQAVIYRQTPGNLFNSKVNHFTGKLKN